MGGFALTTFPLIGLSDGLSLSFFLLHCTGVPFLAQVEILFTSSLNFSYLVRLSERETKKSKKTVFYLGSTSENGKFIQIDHLLSLQFAKFANC